MNAPRGFVVAIDGPSGAGKTAAGMLLAKQVGAVFVDTGIFYRAVTLLALSRGIPISHERALVTLTEEISSEIVEAGPGCRVLEVRVRGESPGAAIRSAAVDSHVAEVASHPGVRRAVLNLQREAAQGSAAIVAGRDIGTVVFPDAPLKVYLDAAPEERALRRARQVGALARDADVTQALAARDARDAGRAVAPLARAADAIVVDTDELSLEQVAQELIELVRQKLGTLRV